MPLPKQKLIPVSSPWMISPSAPYLELQLGLSDEPLSATFIGYFRDKDDLSHVGISVESLPQRIDHPEAFSAEAADNAGPFQMIRVSFIGGLFGRVRPSASDIEVIPEKDFDWSAVPGSLGNLVAGQTISGSRRKFAAQWHLTGICPNPRMYEVGSSTWLGQLGIDEGAARHLILAGHDEYVEVVAEGWQWEFGQSVD